MFSFGISVGNWIYSQNLLQISSQHCFIIRKKSVPDGYLFCIMSATHLPSYVSHLFSLLKWISHPICFNCDDQNHCVSFFGLFHISGDNVCAALAAARLSDSIFIEEDVIHFLVEFQGWFIVFSAAPGISYFIYSETNMIDCNGFHLYGYRQYPICYCYWSFRQHLLYNVFWQAAD